MNRKLRKLEQAAVGAIVGVAVIVGCFASVTIAMLTAKALGFAPEYGVAAMIAALVIGSFSYIWMDL